MNPIKITLPLKRQTPGALVYEVPSLTSVAVGKVYVRKDKIRETGYTGPWPEEITITLEATAV